MYTKFKFSTAVDLRIYQISIHFTRAHLFLNFHLIIDTVVDTRKQEQLGYISLCWRSGRPGPAGSSPSSGPACSRNRYKDPDPDADSAAVTICVWTFFGN